MFIYPALWTLGLVQMATASLVWNGFLSVWSVVDLWRVHQTSQQSDVHPDWVNVYRKSWTELTKLVHMRSLVLVGVMILKYLCQFQCSYVLTWIEIYVAFRTMLLYWETLLVEVPLFVSGISRTPTIFSLFREGTTTSTTIQMPLRQNEIVYIFWPLIKIAYYMTE